jgi:hypothetical protein
VRSKAGKVRLRAGEAFVFGAQLPHFYQIAISHTKIDTIVCGKIVQQPGGGAMSRPELSESMSEEYQKAVERAAFFQSWLGALRSAVREYAEKLSDVTYDVTKAMAV